MAGPNTGQPPHFRNPQEFRIALEGTLKEGDAGALLAVLTSPTGEAVPRTWDDPAAIAAANGDTRCLHVFQYCGFVLSNRTWAEAAEHGHVNCLAFAVSQGYKLKDSVLEKAACNGHLACVEFLLQQGLPRKPYLHSVYPARPDHLKCIQLMLDKKVAVNPQTLIVAAGKGDLDFVRWLHKRGVSLWEHAEDQRISMWKPPREDPTCPLDIWLHELQLGRHHNEVPPGTLSIPWGTHALDNMWKTLRYWARHGAPINRRARPVLAEKRCRTHAVLLCFKAAARLCQGPGCAEQRGIWASMAALPSALVEELLIAADLEIPESVTRRPPLRAPAVAGCKGLQGRSSGQGRAPRSLFRGLYSVANPLQI